MAFGVIQIIPAQDRCQDCHRREATKLCDFAFGETGVTFYRNYQKFRNQQPGLITCDKPLCNKCARKFFAMDICKGHYKKIEGGRR